MLHSWRELGPRAAGLLGRVWLIALVSAVVSWAICSLWWPYGGDQGCFSFVADTILRGGLPYRDAWDFKGPLTFGVYVALQSLFGRQMWAVRVLDLLLLTGAGFAVVHLVGQFASKRAALITALMITLSFASFGNWYTAQPDGWAALALIVVSALLSGPGRPSARNVGLAAGLIGCCTLLKPLYAGYLLLIVCSLWPTRREERGAAFKGLGWAAFCWVLPIVVTVGWLAARGVLSDMIDVHLRFNFERIRSDPHLQMPLPRVLQVTVGILSTVPALAMVLPAAALGLGYLARERPRMAVLILFWVLLSLGLIAAQRKFLSQNYAWHPLYPPLGILAGIGLSRLWNAESEELRPARWLVAITAFLLFKQVVHAPLAQTARWLRYARGRTTLAEYRASFDLDIPALNGASAMDVGFSISRDIALGDFLAKHTAPDDESSVWIDPLANYLGNRPTMTPITVANAFTTWGSEERRRRYRAQLLERMTSVRAAYFAAPTKDLRPSEDETNLRTHFPELLEVLATHYDDVGTIGDVQLFRHRPEH